METTTLSSNTSDNTVTTINTPDTNDTTTTTESVLLESVSLGLTIIIAVLLIFIKKLITKYRKLQNYGITEENSKLILLWLANIIKNNIAKKIQKEDIKIDIIEDNVDKTTVTNVSNNLKTTITEKINNIEKFNSSTPDKGVQS